MKEFVLEECSLREYKDSVLIIQARMGSTRLRGKVLKLLRGRPVLEWMLLRFLRYFPKEKIILATSHLEQDRVLVELAHKHSLKSFQGSEEDVLDRFSKAVSKREEGVVVRLTADCPLHDPCIVKKALSIFSSYDGDYLSNTLRRTFPQGFDTEVMTKEALLRADKSSKDLYDREHVTPYIYRHPENFRLSNFITQEDLSSWRLTLDTERDFHLLEKIFQEVDPLTFTYSDIKALLENHPEWHKINQ